MRSSDSPRYPVICFDTDYRPDLWLDGGQSLGHALGVDELSRNDAVVAFDAFGEAYEVHGRGPSLDLRPATRPVRLGDYVAESGRRHPTYIRRVDYAFGLLTGPRAASRERIRDERPVRLHDHTHRYILGVVLVVATIICLMLVRWAQQWPPAIMVAAVALVACVRLAQIGVVVERGTLVRRSLLFTRVYPLALIDRVDLTRHPLSLPMGVPELRLLTISYCGETVRIPELTACPSMSERLRDTCAGAVGLP